MLLSYLKRDCWKMGFVHNIVYKSHFPTVPFEVTKKHRKSYFAFLIVFRIYVLNKNPPAAKTAMMIYTIL